MKNNEFVKVLKLNQRNIEDSQITNITEENIIKMNKYNFLIKALEIHNKRKYEPNEHIKDFIKLMLPADEEQAQKQWFDGVTYEGNTYIAWFATIGGMKQENKKSKCETIFVRENLKSFTSNIENVISLGRFENLEKQEKEICINKIVLSRLSLITTDLLTEIEMPNFIVLKKAELDLIRDYKTVDPREYEETEGDVTRQKVDYDLIDYHFNDKLEKFDGCGIATSKVFEQIGNQLNRNDIEFAIIRGYSNATKGLISKFDIIGYLDEFYTHDTEFCKKINGQYHLLDMYDQFQIVTDNTMLLNESMVKLSGEFKDMADYRKNLEKLKTKEPFNKYYNLVNKLYISKVNKQDSEISDYKRTNYQLINALALTFNDIKLLAEQDMKLYRKILKPFEFDGNVKDFVANIDYIKIFFKNCVSSDLDIENLSQEEIFDIAENVVNKTNELININPDFVKLNYTATNLKRLIEKKLRDLASGKITVKGKIEYCVADPIAYMNFAMYRTIDDGLNDSQFYSYECKNEDVRTISRNPLCAYSEVHNVDFIRNEFLDKWLCHSKEMIYFNQKSDIESLLSGSDFDGDFVFVIDNEIIKNAVIIPKDGKYFVTKLDGNTIKLKYNAENRFISTYRASGNLIGKIALKAANVNSNSQYMPYYYDTRTDDFISYFDLKENIGNAIEDISAQEIDDIIDKLKKDEIIAPAIFGDFEDRLKKNIRRKFYDNEKDIFICLYNSMCAIDAPKTLTFLDEKFMDIIEKKYERKTYFLQYVKNKNEVVKRDYYYNEGSLDRFARFINMDYLDKIEHEDYRNRSELLQRHIKNDAYNVNLLDECQAAIEILYKKFNAERDVFQKIYNEKSYDLKMNRRDYSEMYPEKQYKQDIAELQEIKNNEYKKIDEDYKIKVLTLIKKYEILTVSQAISQMKNCSEKFIITFFFNCLFQNDAVRFLYQKSEDGDIEYLYEKYKKIEINGFNNSKVIEKLVAEDKPNLRFKMTDSSIIDDIKEGLLNGLYELDLSDERIELIEEYKAKIDAGTKKINIIEFDKKKDGTDAISAKSFGIIFQK